MTRYQIQQTRQSIFYMCLLTLKTLITIMVIGFGLLYAVISIKSAEAATLKPLAVVNDEVVRVGDLFSDAGEKADVVIGNAPAVGSDITLSARTLLRVAAAHGVQWTPQSASEQVIVRREAHTISPLELQDVVKAALNKQGLSSEYSVTLNELRSALVLPANLPATAEVVNLSYTPGRDFFTATVAAPSAAQPVKTINVSGTVEKTLQIPVLKSSVRAGEIIGSTDLEWVDIAERVLMPDTITDADDLIGKTPARQIALNKPIRAKEVTNPQLVGRGDDITIIFKAGGMQLTAKGKAMQNGAEGDLVRVVNASTNRSVTAMVSGDRTVEVQ